MPPTLLITRPATDGQALARDLRGLGVNCDAIIAPVMEILPLAFDHPTGVFDLMVLSSRHAVDAAQSFADVPAICVGPATSHTALSAGIEVLATFSNADALLSDATRHAGKRALYLHGRHTRGQIAERLNSANVETMDRAVYEQAACDWSPEVKRRVLSQSALLVPVYSPRSARLVAQNLHEFTGSLVLIGLSEACLDAWDGPMPNATFLSERPDGAAMKRAIASQFP